MKELMKRKANVFDTVEAYKDYGCYCDSCSCACRTKLAFESLKTQRAANPKYYTISTA